MRALICLLGLLACRNPFAPNGASRLTPTAITDSGAVMAFVCGTRFQLRALRTYAQLRLWTVPGRSFDLEGNRSNGNELPASGYQQGADVYVSADYVYLVKLWGHEFLHGLYGLPGNAVQRIPHSPVFSACGLLDF